jgi:DNA-binding response OmpR family regulator
VSAEELLERAWDENADPFSASMRVIIARLRRKLGADSIVTLVGAGYRVP